MPKLARLLTATAASIMTAVSTPTTSEEPRPARDLGESLAPAYADRPCFDSMVVARVVKQTWLPFTPQADVIVMNPPIELGLAVEQNLVGPRLPTRISVQMKLHNKLDTENRHFLFFLVRFHEDEAYSVVGFYRNILTDTDDRLFMPMTAPPEFDGEDDPRFRFLPEDYQDRLRPVRYRARDAWWLRKGELDRKPTCEKDTSGEVQCEWTSRDDESQPVDTSAYPWGALDNNGDMVAKRGLFMEAWADAVRARRCAGGRGGSTAPG